MNESIEECINTVENSIDSYKKNIDYKKLLEGLIEKCETRLEKIKCTSCGKKLRTLITRLELNELYDLIDISTIKFLSYKKYLSIDIPDDHDNELYQKLSHIKHHFYSCIDVIFMMGQFEMNLLVIHADSETQISGTYLIINGYKMFEDGCTDASYVTNSNNFSRMCEELDKTRKKEKDDIKDIISHVFGLYDEWLND